MRPSTRANSTRTSPNQGQDEADERNSEKGAAKGPEKFRRRPGTRRGTMTTHACLACRDKRTKCDGKKPCDRCRRRDVECRYVGKPWQSKGCLRQQTESLRKHLRQRETVLQALASQSDPHEIVQWLRNGDSIDTICQRLDNRRGGPSSAADELLEPALEPELFDVFDFGESQDLHHIITGGPGGGGGGGGSNAADALLVGDQPPVPNFAAAGPAAAAAAATDGICRDNSSAASSYSATSGLQSEISPPTQNIPAENINVSEPLSAAAAAADRFAIHPSLQDQRVYQWPMDEVSDGGPSQVDFDQQANALYPNMSWSGLGDPNFPGLPPDM